MSERIASHPHADVWRARFHGRDCAVKVSSRAAGSDDQRGERELKAVLGLEHPGIAQCLHTYSCDSAHVLISEWIDGTLLSDELSLRRVEWRDARTLLRDLTKALHAVHSRGLVHRDVKPANILLPARPRVRGSSVVLLDFGHAFWVDETRLTETGTAVGTAEYLAPEVAAGAVPDARADLYAVGVLAYRFATGRLPFAHPSPARVIEMQLDESPPPLGPDVVGEPADLIPWLLAKNPDDRLPNSHTLLQILR